jgi:hypothetical protein
VVEGSGWLADGNFCQSLLRRLRGHSSAQDNVVRHVRARAAEKLHELKHAQQQYGAVRPKATTEAARSSKNQEEANQRTCVMLGRVISHHVREALILSLPSPLSMSSRRRVAYYYDGANVFFFPFQKKR